MNIAENRVPRSAFICDAEIRDIPGYEGLYAVTRDGRVWGYERAWTTGNYGNIRRHRAARWLRPNVARHGYFVVHLKRSGKGKTMQLHRCVALAWLPNPLHLPSVNHLNSRKTDNRVENLEWCSNGDNKRHSARERRRCGRFCWLRHDMPAANEIGAP
jgi:hypothetical protein